jgi:quercetin dioxygenase-like cupin family protein
MKYVLPPAGDKPMSTAGQPGHSHPGATYAYVIKGAVNSRLGTGPEKPFKAGDAWSEKPGEAHFIVNASKTEPAEVLVVFVLPRGAANTGPAPK